MDKKETQQKEAVYTVVITEGLGRADHGDEFSQIHLNTHHMTNLIHSHIVHVHMYRKTQWYFFVYKGSFMCT